MLTVGTGWRQDGTGPRGTLEVGRGWFLMVPGRERVRKINPRLRGVWENNRLL